MKKGIQEPCEISQCHATLCVNNMNYNCILDSVTINGRGICMQFRKLSTKDWAKQIKE